MFAAFLLPAPDTVLFLLFAANLDLKLLANPTLLVDMDVLHYELHPTGLTRTIFLSTVLTERPPFEVTALIDLLVIEAHLVGGGTGNRVSQQYGRLSGPGLQDIV